MPQLDQTLPITMTLAKDRADGGKTANYTVYDCKRQMQVTNGKGETVVKNAVMGSNGTIYIGHELAGPHTEWVLMPRAMYDQLYTATGRIPSKPELQNIPAPKAKKGGKK